MPARARVAEALDRLPKVTGAMEANKIYVAPGLNEVLVAAFDRAKQMGDEYVSVEHVLLAMGAAALTAEGAAARLRREPMAW